MTVQYLAIDFEYKDTRQARLDLVSAAYSDMEGEPESVWLHQDDVAKYKLKAYLLERRDTHTLLSFNVDAEARALISLGLNPIKFKWIDLQAEWKMLVNHCDKYGYGKHMIDGKIKVTRRPKRTYGAKDETDKSAHDKPPTSLLSCTYKLIGGVDEADYFFKEHMRDLILHTEIYTQAIKDKILSYGVKDIKDLYSIFSKIHTAFKGLAPSAHRKSLIQEMLWRGEAVARAALIASIGYPVSREKVTNFTRNIPSIIKTCQEDINSLFPETFKWDKGMGRYSFNTKKARDWIRSSEYATKWRKTDGGDVSLSLDAFEDHFHYRHDFPRDFYPAQVLRYLKLNKSLNGFRPKGKTSKSQTFFDYYGDDDRAHPYLNAYGAQSSRYQPKAIGFIHLKAAWMRSMVEPQPGYVIAAIDYASEEFLLSALISEDQAMIEAYRSGDVYLYFAKLAEAVPWDGKRKDYEEVRDAFKSTVLGLSYDMGPDALAGKLTQDTGKPHTRADAESYTNKFKKAFPDYITFRESIVAQYAEDSKDETAHIRLPDGWYMWGDNDNPRSVGNMPIQGVGACILRKAIQLCQDAGLVVIIPLHDALYFEMKVENYTKDLDIARRCMREAFSHYFEGEMKTLAHELIRMDVKVWGPDLEEGKSEDGTVTQKVFVDGRSKKEYEIYSKYFIKQ